MQAHVEFEGAHGLGLAQLAPGAIAAAEIPDCDLETPFLPRDHPVWMRDAIAISVRARKWLAAVKPIAVQVLTFWDHAVRRIAVGGRNLCVDASGSYRVD